MDKLTPSDLYSLEEYHKVRPEFRARVLAHKKNRHIAVGPLATLYFEDRLTMQYQVQEMLRIERIFESEAIEDELSAYNPLIPDGTNLKATFMIEVPDVEERREALRRLNGIELKVYAKVAGHDRVYAKADEDLERVAEGKTSAVHFLRFELSSPLREALRQGAALKFGIDHAEYRHEVGLSPEQAASIAADLD